MRNVTRELRGRITEPVDTTAEDAVRAAAERLRYALDPFAHLDAVEEWETDTGLRRVGHVFVPDTITQEDVPLRPYDHQRAVISAVVDLPVLQATHRLVLRNVHVEKSRQMGLTWIFAWLWLWAVSYHEIALGYSNMKAAEVDDGGSGSTIDSFFGKIRHLHASLPPRFRAPLRFRGGNDPTISYVGRPRAFITGSGATPDPGRGGRYGGWLFDEAAFFPFGEQAHKALSRAVPRGLVYNSTPYGEGNVYFRLRDTRPANWTFERYHWTKHPVFGDGAHVAPDVADPHRDQAEDPGPVTVAEALAENLKRQPDAAARKAAAGCELCLQTAQGVRWSASEPLAHRFPGKLTSPWYDDAVLDLSDEQVASELDIDYAASLTARVYPKFSEEQHVVERIPYEPEIHEVTMSIDYGLDVTAIAIFQETVRELRQIGELEVSDADPDAVVRELRRYLLQLGVAADDVNSATWLLNQRVIGDPAADYREVGTARTLAQTYQEAGLQIEAPAVAPVARTIVGVQRLLNGRPKRYLLSRETCPATIRHWKLNRWPVDRNGNRKAGATAPVDDEHNHMLRGIAYYVRRRWPVGEQDVRSATEKAAAAARDRAEAAQASASVRGVRQGMRL